jgi:predicted O-methyltransferase YrrM
MKPLRLLSLLPSHPEEFYDRSVAIASSRWEAWWSKRPAYRTTDLDGALRTLSAALNRDCFSLLSEPARSEIDKLVQERNSTISADAPFATFHNADSRFAALCYVVTRALRPKLVVETGVCYGVTSAHILQALNANTKGHLHSIDLPPLGKNADDHVGRLVPQELRSRWSLHRGISGRVLGPLLAELGSIDLFIHDSLHTYRTMRDEFALAWPVLRSGGVLISDDVQGNAAFQELASRFDVCRSAVLEEQGKDVLLGIAVKGS